MSVTATSLSDTLPSSVPKLEMTGTNWAIFEIRFRDAIEAKGFWGHFDGQTKRPVSGTPAVMGTDGKVITPAIGLTPEEFSTEMTQWEKDERSAKSLLNQKIPDSTLMRIRSKTTVEERWNAIQKEYTEKGAYAQTELRQKFLESKCMDKGNVREFLDSLRVKREELAAVGVDIEEKDYRSTILSSLPIALANFASAQLAAARMYSTSKTLDPDVLISLIGEEYDRQKMQRSRRHGGKSKEEDKDEAMAVNPSSSNSKGGKGGAKKPRGECWNCGEKGHYKNKCPKPPKNNKEKEDSPKKEKASGSANAAAERNSDSESEGAWAAMELDDEMEIDSEAGSFSSDDDEWFSETEEVSEHEDKVLSDLLEEPMEVFVITEPPKSGHAEMRAELYDSGCTQHISPYREDFSIFTEIPPKAFHAANKQSFSATGKGEMIIDVPNGAEISQLALNEVLYSSEVGYTLISIGKLDDMGFSITFSGGKCSIQGPDGELIGEVPKSSKGLYKVQHERGGEAKVAEEILTLDSLHRRLGHISPKTAQKLIVNGFITGLHLEPSPNADFFCESCVYAKATRKSIPKAREGERAKEFGGEIHSDVWGPAPVESKGGKRYYITFTDDKTRFTNLYLLAKKSDAFESYKTYEAWCSTQLDARIKVLHSDRGGEYLGKEFILHLNSKGTKQKLTVHDTPQQNGVAERRNRTIVERIRALLHSSGLPKSLWGEAARHVVWLMNRTFTKAVDDMTPYEAAFLKKPNLGKVREWGEKVWVRTEGGDKLGRRVREGRWLGLDERSKGVRIYWPDTKSVSVERNVYTDNTLTSVSRIEGENIEGFVEANPDSPASTQKSKLDFSAQSLPTPSPVSNDQTPHNLDPASENPPSDPAERPKRVRKPTQKVKDIMEGVAVSSYVPNAQTRLAPGVQPPTKSPQENERAPEKPGTVLEGEGQPDWMLFAEEYALAAETSETEALEPRNLAEAKSRPDWSLWEKAIDDELLVLKAAGTWELVDAPDGVNIVGSKWVFRAKKDAAGNVVRYKARLVAQGFSQVPGVDYFDTFAPVARLSSIRAILAIAAAEDYEIHQIDIKGAYLNGILTSDEVIFMKQPPGYATESPEKVCKLRKTLYGLKQSGRRWYQKLVEIMVTHLKFTRCDVDHAVFFKRQESKLMIVMVHVDDCTLVASALPLIHGFKTNIAKHVEITDLGELHWILGIEIRRVRENRQIFLSQRSYIESTLRRYGFDDLKPVSMPMETNIRLTSAQSPTTTEEFARMRNIPYHEAVGSLMYASLGTRPDITYAVQTVSRFSTKPGIAHWEAVKRIFRYLKGTKDLWLSYGGKKRELIGYADADGNMAEDRHAISGYAFLLHGGAVSWSAKRQEIISLSTTESEYVAATYAAKEALWLRSLLSQTFDTNLEITTLFSDNQSAIALTQDHQYHARTKHIDIRFHFIRWIVENGPYN